MDIGRDEGLPPPDPPWQGKALGARVQSKYSWSVRLAISSPRNFIDRYQEALRELIKAKAAGRGPTKTRAPVIQGNVVDLMDALRRGLKADKSGAEKPSQSGKRVAKGDKWQQGLLLR